MLPIVFGIHCNLIIVFSIRLEICRWNEFFFFTKQNMRARKIRRVSEVLRAWARPIDIGCAICSGLRIWYIKKVPKKTSYKWLLLWAVLFWKKNLVVNLCLKYDIKNYLVNTWWKNYLLTDLVMCNYVWLEQLNICAKYGILSDKSIRFIE